MLWSGLIVFLAVCPVLVRPQGSGPEATQNFEFFMDSSRDCNGPVYNIFDKEAVIKGQSSQPVQQSPPTCTVRLHTENNFEKTRFRITIRRMRIDDPDVNLVIYDGEPGQILIDSYDIGTSGRRPERITTSNQVSFVLTRRNAMNTNYDIEIVVTPLVAGVDPGYDNDWGNDYGFFNRLVPNMVIYIIVGVLFVIIIVIIIIVGIVCHRKHKGLTKKAEQYKLSYISNNTNLSRAPASEMSTRTWVTTSRNSLRRERKPPRHDDDESVFDGSEADSIPSKKRYNPDQSRERHNTRPCYRNDAYAQPDYNHTQNTYIEREMKPRVRSTRRSYDQEEEEEEESIGVGPNEEETEEEEEDEEEIEEEENEDAEEEEGDAEDVHSFGAQQSPPHHVPDQPPPRLKHHPATGVPEPAPRHLPPHDQPRSYPADPSQMPVAGPYGPRYVVYPSQPKPQFMPMVPGPGQFQPIHPPMSMPLPPRYPGHLNQETPRPYQVKPSDPPIYSYLVQRGYNPEDGRESPVSVSTNASGRSDSRLIKPEDSDMSAHNLDAGVEYMRR